MQIYMHVWLPRIDYDLTSQKEAFGPAETIESVVLSGTRVGCPQTVSRVEVRREISALSRESKSRVRVPLEGRPLWRSQRQTPQASIRLKAKKVVAKVQSRNQFLQVEAYRLKIITRMTIALCSCRHHFKLVEIVIVTTVLLILSRPRVLKPS